MLRKIRVILAIIFFVIVSLLFLDFTGTIHSWFGWMAKVQFLPALLATNIIVVMALVLLTLVFGRIYCSVICPLGVFQDLISRLAKTQKKNRFRYSKSLKWLRLGVLAVFVAAFVLGVGSIVALLGPYSAYGRIVSNLFAPVWQAGNNILAHFAQRADSYLFYEKQIWIKSMATFVIAALTCVVIAVLAWKNGRTYCNTICPVGTILGYLAKFSILKPYFDKDNCNKCGLCARNCKASCIDSKNQTVDSTRCVSCFNCVDICKKGAMIYGRKPKEGASAKTEDPAPKTDENLRKTLFTTSLMIGSAALAKAQIKVDGGYAVLIDKQVPKRENHIVPPGAKSIKNFATKCTGCQLCVSVCPNQVLRPSVSLDRLMQPELSYERGFCRPECTKCSEVCPAGAIEKITRAEKTAIQVGHAVWVGKNCLVLTDDIDCGACARHCPTGSIMMVLSDPNDPNSRKIPAIHTDYCIGCGACENLCPAAPFSAIYVEGLSRHIIL